MATNKKYKKLAFSGFEEAVKLVPVNSPRTCFTGAE